MRFIMNFWSSSTNGSTLSLASCDMKSAVLSFDWHAGTEALSQKQNLLGRRLPKMKEKSDICRRCWSENLVRKEGFNLLNHRIKPWRSTTLFQEDAEVEWINEWLSCKFILCWEKEGIYRGQNPIRMLYVSIVANVVFVKGSKFEV